MAIDQLNLIKKQTETTLRNKAAGSVAKFRAETSLVKQASRLTGRMNRELKQAEQILIRSGKPGKYRVETQTVAEAPGQTGAGWLCAAVCCAVHPGTGRLSP